MERKSGDSGLRSFVSVQGSLAMFPIHAYGSEEQKQKFLPEMAAGSMIGCFGLTRGRRRQRPHRDADHGHAQGRWMGHQRQQDVDHQRVARRRRGHLGEDRRRRARVPGERGTPGFTATDIHRKLSLRASVTSELRLDAVEVPESAVLPGVSGMRGPLSCLNEARYGIAWGAMGAARACFVSAVDYSRTRRMFDRPIGGFQLTQAKLATMATSLVQGRLVAHRLGTLKDQGRLHPVQVSLAKRANVRAALDIAREARTILGANGITLEYPVVRHMNNLESVLTYEGTEEVHTLILGKAITGEDAFA